MKKTILILSILLLGLTQFSCKEDVQPLTKTEMLTGKTWKITSKILNPAALMGGISITDVMILDTDDQRNFTFKYNADGTVIQYNSLNKEIFRTKWSFNADETVLTYAPGIVFTYAVAGNFTLSTMNITSISADKMVAKVDYIFGGTTYLATFTYEPK
jgi:hypothetical protein